MSSVDLHVSASVVWVGASLTARSSGAGEIGVGHLLLAILRLADGMAERETALLNLDDSQKAALAFAAERTTAVLGLDPRQLTDVRRSTARRLHCDGEMIPPARMLHRTPETRLVFKEAAGAARSAGDSSLTAVHLAQVLLARGVLRRAIEGEPLDGETAAPVEGSGTQVQETLGKDGMRLGRDLTALARAGRLGPVVGRDAEIKQLARRLQRTTKRNALLIGDAGVGKTAIVEGLATFCAGEEAPSQLRDTCILEISSGDLLAGARYRGDLEQRIQILVSRLQGEPNLVAFIDEVHLVLVRQGEDAPSIANLLKPVLDGDSIRCIAATTTEEYERHVKQDAAFARRFGRPIMVQEPSRDVAALILSQWKQRIEEVHPGLNVSDEAVAAALELSLAHMPDRRLPDKAIDLLDDAATFALLPTIHELATDAPSKCGLVLCREHVEAVLREQYGIDVSMVGVSGQRLREVLAAELIGQEEAVDSIVAIMGTARRSAESQRPLRVLLFTGPTGTGKTFSAELISGALFGSTAKLCRLNMSEYKDRHEIGRLTGAPPGYVGHERPGALFAFIEGHPEGVILLDEIEKAHPDVREYFLQVFDTGEALDSRGRRASFGSYVFIMTSNALTKAPQPLGFARPTSGAVVDAERTEAAVREDLAMRLTPEFVARIDAVVLFKALSPQSLDALVRRYVAEAADELRQVDGADLTVSDEALEELSMRGQLQAEGARGVRRLVDREVIAVARATLAETDLVKSEGRSLRLDLVDGEFKVAE